MKLKKILLKKKSWKKSKIMSFMHEIKTPLSLIMGFGELIQDKYKR